MNILSVVAGILVAAGEVPYVCAILRGKSQPSKATWLLWAVLDVIVLAGMLAKGTVNSQIVVSTCGAILITVLAFKYGLSGWKKLDKFCLAGAAAGVVLWGVFNSPVLGIIMSLSVMIIGSVPTMTNALKENRLAWVIWESACVVTLFNLPQWTPAAAIQPLVFCGVNSVMLFLLFIPSKKCFN